MLLNASLMLKHSTWDIRKGMRGILYVKTCSIIKSKIHSYLKNPTVSDKNLDQRTASVAV